MRTVFCTYILTRAKPRVNRFYARFPDFMHKKSQFLPTAFSLFPIMENAISEELRFCDYYMIDYYINNYRTSS